MNDSKDINVVFVEPLGSYSNVFAQFMTIPMLGPIYLGTIAKNAGYKVAILNENILGRKVRIAELLEADILCLSCMTATIDRGKAIAKQYKDLREARGLPSHSIIGGIHASMLPDDVVDHFDQVFVGEGEIKFVDLLAGKFPEKIVYGDRLKDLDNVPIPDFKLIKNYQRIKVYPLMTSRGCPYNCTFCSVTEMFGRGYRIRSIENVMDEIKAQGQNRYFFVDDHFVVNKNRTRKLLDEIYAYNPKLKWSCQLRAEVARDPQLVNQMKETGCQTVYIGFESINPESLKEIKKSQTVEDIKNSIRVFNQNAIDVHGMFMFGSDSDDKDIFQTTSRFCKESGLSSVQYLILTPLPGTVFYKQIEADGRLLHKNWAFYDALHVVFQPKNLTPAELQLGMIECFNDFYSYANAFNEAINIFFRTCGALFTRLHRRVYFPSINSSLVKLFGKKIVKKWVNFNKPYMGYLKIISMNLLPDSFSK
ncbi:B12-binding domain-containing radical SAM protein [bacterium]|nr:B12-binding domain-containing radical SAM protein [bacterium]